MPQRVNFLFWNLYNKPIEKHIKNLVDLHAIDVLLLAECAIPPIVLLKTLNEKEKLFEYSSIEYEKIKVFAKFNEVFIRPIFENNRLTIRKLNIPSMEKEILVASVHFQGKHNWTDEDQFSECFNLTQTIQKTESYIGHQRTILIGDFNMNPFEKGMVGANVLHAIGDRNIALKKNRTVAGNQYDYFYNPMWSFFRGFEQRRCCRDVLLQLCKSYQLFLEYV